jgi:hypothetical protein
MPPDAEARLIAIARSVFRESGIPKAALALWWPRFLRAATWFVGVERERRAGIKQSFVEIAGGAHSKVPPAISRCAAAPTGSTFWPPAAAPSSITRPESRRRKKQVRVLLAPQLPLEGAILAEGGFEAIGKLAPSELLYIRFGGGDEPGEVRDVSDVIALVRKGRAATHRPHCVFRRRGHALSAAHQTVPRRCCRATTIISRACANGRSRDGSRRNERCVARPAPPPIPHARPGCRPMPARARLIRSPIA